MSINVNLIRKKSQGVAVKQSILKTKSDLVYTKEGLHREKDEISGASGTLDSSLEAAIKKADDQKAIMLEQTDPELVITATDEWAKLQNDVGKLRKKAKVKGPAAVLLLEIEMDQIDLRVNYLDSVDAQLDTRIAEVPA